MFSGNMCFALFSLQISKIVERTQNSKRLYIVRHGQTDYNKRGMVQGRGIDAPLNENGIKQAHAFYEAFKHVQFEKAYVSCLQRTRQSIGQFLENGLSYERLSGLDEISWGSQEGVAFSAEGKNLYLETIEKWKAGEVHEVVAGGESPVAVMTRQKLAIEHILGGDEKLVLICMHGRAIRILMSWLLHYELKDMDEFPHNNLGLYQLFYTGSSFQIEKLNEVAHLDGLDLT